VFLHVAGALYFCVSQGLSQGLGAQGLWAGVLGLAVGLDGLGVQPLKVFLVWVLLVQGQVGKLLRALAVGLSRRSRLALMRSSGLLRDAGDLLQTLNPAVRVAREVPHLHGARLLLSLNDLDVAVYPNLTRGGFGAGEVPFWLLDLTCEAALVLLLGAGLWGLMELYWLSPWALLGVLLGAPAAVLLAMLLARLGPFLGPGVRRVLNVKLLRARTVYQDFYDLRDEVKDDEGSISTKGSFGARRSKYRHKALGPVEDLPAPFKPRARGRPPPVEAPTLTLTSHATNTSGSAGTRKTRRGNRAAPPSGPGSPFSGPQDRRPMINSATALSDHRLVGSHAALPAIDVLSRDGTAAGRDGTGLLGVVSAMDNNGPGRHFALFVDDDDLMDSSHPTMQRPPQAD